MGDSKRVSIVNDERTYEIECPLCGKNGIIPLMLTFFKHGKKACISTCKPVLMMLNDFW